MDGYSAVRWSAFSKYGAQGMQFVISMVMARLLAPEYFGLLGMATVITGFVKIFRDLGFNSAIVQRKKISDDLLSTLFWVNLGVCIFVGLVVLAIAPLAAWMYDDPRVTPIIAVLSITFLFAGFTMIPAALLQRQMEFKKLALREIGGVTAAGGTAIPLAYFGWGVWALVAATLASSAVQMILINLAVPFRPAMVIDRAGLRECLRFGLNLTGFNIFNYFARNADNLIIGVFLGPVALGYYSLAYKLMLVPRDSVSSVVTRVLFPKLSKLQDNNVRLAEVCLRTSGAIALVTFPMMIGLTVLADPFVRVAIGEKWLLAIPLIQILAPVGMLESASAPINQIYVAKGRTDLLFRMGILRGVIRVASFLVGVHWGVLGVAASYAMAVLPLYFLNLAVISHISPEITISASLRVLKNPLIASFACGATSFLAQLFAPGISAYTLLIAVASGSVSYVLSVYLIDPIALVTVRNVAFGGVRRQ
ncbi:MOP flippase family protein [Roseiconus nitratireducens]|uniref:MOP flippase family protein n=1 Tax=Roseiconus nitratireducens TaxID=2605748 RepID=A0A5M6DJ99_9BACT|nr:MOP flippase family protein [Roseiconus nitratireducens]KAA5546289.1 MOP flippase family protein [Roseiconus nitratireducens]